MSNENTLKLFSPGHLLFGRFVLLDKLGEGGMGVVWKARDARLNRDIALKFLPETLATDAAMVAHLKKETQQSIELSHPSVVRVYDFLYEDHLAAISMELVSGKTLAQHKFSRNPPVFNPRDLEPLLPQICQALDYAHQTAKIVHRDLKPSNLMLTDSGQLKILDFGISAIASENTRASSANVIAGTVPYMSPQQLAGLAPRPADDWYSLGATLYDLLSGKPPFYHGDLGLQIRETSPGPIAQRRQELGILDTESIPEEWEKLVSQLLAKQASERPTNGTEVLKLLKLSSQGKRRDERDRHKSPDPLKRTSKRKGAVGIALLTFILSGVVFTYRQEIKDRFVQDQSQTPDQREAKNPGEKHQAKPTTTSETGEMDIQTEPSQSNIMIDGRPIGRGPQHLSGVSAGAHLIAIEHEGFDRKEERIEVNGGKTTNIYLTLMASPALVQIPAVPQPQIATEKPTVGKSYTVPNLEMALVPIPAGSFSMGSNDGAVDERPVHQVTLTKAFWLARFPVTQAEWVTVMKDNPSRFRGDRLPVDSVAYTRAKEFCQKLTQRERAAGRLPEGYVYALPSEAQWEYAGLAGANRNAPENVLDGAWCLDNAAHMTHEVGGKKENGWGLCDMLGNVWQWCEDSKGNYNSDAVVEPKGPENASERVTRGGSWLTPSTQIRYSLRNGESAQARLPVLGFRVALISSSR